MYKHAAISFSNVVGATFRAFEFMNNSALIYSFGVWPLSGMKILRSIVLYFIKILPVMFIIINYFAVSNNLIKHACISFTVNFPL